MKTATIFALALALPGATHAGPDSFPYPKRTNANARLVPERGGSLPLRIEASLGVSWENLGVNDGPVFR